MATGIKAIVFKTTQLEATKHFFESVLRLPIRESSLKHFVVHSKGIRLVFLDSDKNFEVEFFVKENPFSLNEKTESLPEYAGFQNCKDPNGISIIKFREN